MYLFDRRIRSNIHVCIHFSDIKKTFIHKKKMNETQSNENKFSFQNIDSDVRFIKGLIWKIYPRQDVLGIKRKKVDQKCSKY